VEIGLGTSRDGKKSGTDARQQQEKLQEKIIQLKLAIYDREKRQAAIDRLWELRKKGVELRNKNVTVSEYPMWETEFEAWTAEICEEANKISPNLRNWLTILDRVRPPPMLSHQPAGPLHANTLKNMSEVLARIQEFLEAEMLKRDIEHHDTVSL
jgi:hypothetical protein